MSTEWPRTDIGSPYSWRCASCPPPARTVRALRSAVDLVGDHRQDVVDLGSEQGERNESNDHDEGDDERVLSKALTRVALPTVHPRRDLLHGSDSAHGC